MSGDPELFHTNVNPPPCSCLDGSFLPFSSISTLVGLPTPRKTRLEALQKIMTSRSHAVPARATQESLRLLSTLEKDIPVMHALTNANMKDRHWWQVR